MSVLNEKKITIHLPRFTWKSLFTFRVGAAVLLLTFTALFSYWYQTMRPYLWVSHAHVNAHSSQINAETNGKIIEMCAEEGERIQKGQTLYVLDNDSILTHQKQVQASIHSLNQQIQAEKERMEKVMHDYLAASTELDLGIGSQEMVAHQLAFLEESQIKSEQAALQITQYQNDLVLIDQQIKEMRFTAPFASVVLKKSKLPGEWISRGDPIYYLSDPAQTWVDAEISEKELGQVVLGTPAKVRIAAFPKKEWQGKVTWIGPATVSKVSSLPFSEDEKVAIKVSIDNPEFSLIPGLSAEVGLKVH